MAEKLVDDSDLIITCYCMYSFQFPECNKCRHDLDFTVKDICCCSP